MKKVLVIEDNKDNLFLITCALQHSGYEVLSTDSGEKGIEIALKEPPYFIIMDINLPGMDGIETTKRIRSFETVNNIPVIAMTSHAMLGDRERIMQAGCNGYFEKPIDPLTIVERILKIIGSSSK